MNIKIADFLFEEDRKDKEIFTDTDEQDAESNDSQDQDDEGRKKIRAKLSDDDIFSDVELKLAEVEVICKNIAKLVMSSDPKLNDAKKFKESIKDKSPDELTPDEVKTQDEFKKIEEQPLGFLTKDILMQLFKKNFTVGYSGKIGKIHLNPVQMVIGKDQVEGATPQDLEKYKDTQHYFAMLSDQNSKAINCNGKVVIIAIPALLSNLINNIDLYNITYPGISEENPVMYNVDKVFFTLLSKNDIKAFQTDPKKIRTFLSREKQQESFVYKKGIKSFLLESTGGGDYTGSAESTEADDDSESSSGPDKDSTTPKGKILKGFEDLGFANSIKNSLSSSLDDVDDNSPRKLKKAFNSALKTEIDKYCNGVLRLNVSNKESILDNIGAIYYKDYNSDDDGFVKSILINIYYNFIDRPLNSIYDEYESFANSESVNDFSISEIKDRALPELSDKQRKTVKSKVLKIFSSATLKTIADGGDKDALLDAIGGGEGNDYVVNADSLKKKLVGYFTRDMIFKSDFIEGKVKDYLNTCNANKAAALHLEKIAEQMVSYFDDIKKDQAASKILQQKITSGKIREEQIPLYILKTLIKFSPDYFEEIRGKINEKFEEFLDIDNHQAGNFRQKAFLIRLTSLGSKFMSVFSKSDFAEMGIRLWVNSEYKVVDFGNLFESKISLSNLLLEVDDEEIGKSDFGTEIDTKKVANALQTVRDLLRRISANQIKKSFLKLFDAKDFAPVDNNNMPKFFKKIKTKEDKEYSANLSKFLNKKISGATSQRSYIEAKENIANYLSDFIKLNVSPSKENKSFESFIDNVINDYIKNAMENIEKEVAEQIKDNKGYITDIFLEDEVPDIDLRFLETEPSGDSFTITGKQKTNPIQTILKKRKEFDDNDPYLNPEISKILIAILFVQVLGGFSSTFLEISESDTPTVTFVKDEFVSFIKTNDFLDSLLNSVIRDFEENVLITSDVEEELREKYINSLEEEAWNKFVIYAYFYEPEKKLSTLLRENIVSKERLLSRALYENDDFAAQTLLNEFSLWGLALDPSIIAATALGVAGSAAVAYGKFKSKKTKKPQVSDESRSYLSTIIDNILNGADTEEPLGWKSSIESAEEAGLSEVEKENLNLARVKNNCSLIINSTYKALIKEEWKEFSKERDSKKQDKKDQRKDFYEKSGEKVKLGSTLGFGTMAIGALATGGLSLLPIAVGGLLLTDEIGSLGGGLLKTGLKLGDAGISGLAGKIASATGANKQSLQEKLDLLDYDVNLKEEIDALYNTYRDIAEKGEGLEESVLESAFVHKNQSFTKLLLEDSDDTSDSSADSKKKPLREIDESVVTQILEGNGLQLFTSDFDSQNIYNTFFVKLNGTLRKYARVVIKNIKNKPIVKQLAKDQASEVADSEAKVGQPASPIIDLLTRQMATTGEPPVAALASALNDVNHSGGGVANLLVYMMLTNPQGFGQMVSSFDGNKDQALQKVIDLMSQASNTDPQRVASAASRGAAPAIEISNDEVKKIGELIEKINDPSTSSPAIGRCLKVAGQKDLDELLRRADDISVKSTKIDRDSTAAQNVYDLFMTILFKPQDTYEFNDTLYINKITSKGTQFFMEAFTSQYTLYNIFAKDRRIIVKDAYANLVDINNITKMREAVCLDHFYLKVDDSVELDISRTPPKDVIKNELGKCDLYKEIEKLKLHESKVLKRVDLLNEDFIGGDLSDLLFENKISKNIVKKEDKINLNKEWRKLWNI